MSRTVRAVLRVVAPLAFAVAVLPVAAAPAQAHPDVSGPTCDAGGGHIQCVIGISGAVNPIDIRWYFNGVHFGQYEDQRFARAGCPIGSRVSVKVVVTDASGVPVTKSTSKLCPRDTP